MEDLIFNQLSYPILTWSVFLPLIGALVLLFMRNASLVRWTALFFTISTFIISLPLLSNFDKSTYKMQFVEMHEWIQTWGIKYIIGIDGISILFLFLTTLLSILCVLVSWKAIQTKTKEFYMAILIMEAGMLGVFVSLDFFLFYIFWEAMLIPMFLVIGVWGGPNRVYATIKIFLYTFLGSVFMLVALVYMYFQSGSMELLAFHDLKLGLTEQILIFLAFLLAFAVKVPMWPVHTWLPDAHVEAPTGGSVILAAIMLKIGGYGFLRFSLPITPDASSELDWLLILMSLVGVVYIGFVALVQEDMKKLIAYSSIAHMGFVTIGIFTLTMQGMQGGIFLMLSHGIVSAALFLCVSVVYDRMHTRDIDAYGGLVNRMPAYAMIFMLFTMANVGLPGTSGFVGEFLTLMATFQVNTWVAAIATTGVIFSAAYALWLYRRVVMGDLIKEGLKAITDMTPRERWIFAPLVVMTLLLGVYPALVLDMIGPSVAALVENYTVALDAADTAVQSAEATH